MLDLQEIQLKHLYSRREKTNLSSVENHIALAGLLKVVIEVTRRQTRVSGK